MNEKHAQKPIHGGDIWTAAEKWGVPMEEILDYSANINPLGPSPRAISAIRDSIPRLTHYPEPTGESCKTALAQYLEVDGSNLVLGNGGSELIYLLGRMFYKGRLVLLAPCFSEYGEGLENTQAVRINLEPREQFRLPLQHIRHILQPGDLIFIGNPNNPSGNLFDKQELLEVAELVDNLGAVMVVDEAFLDFTGNDSFSLRYEATRHPHLIVVGSLTKFFAIPGLRLGYAVANVKHIKRMEYLLPTWRINTLALVAGRASLQDRVYIQTTIAMVAKERRWLTQQLQSLPFLEVFPGESNFLLINAEKSGLTAAEWQQRLGPLGILIRNCSNFHNLSPHYFRVAVKEREQNQRLLKALIKCAP